MAEYSRVCTLAEIEQLDVADVGAGYMHGINGLPLPANSSRSMWHGYRNGLVDGDHAEMDDAQEYLNAQYVALGKVLH